MGSLDSQKTWAPTYLNSKDCSQGFCSLYCPQWCFKIYPPPPPLQFPDDGGSSPTFSPLVVAIIGILASAFLLVSYYAIISKYCGTNTDQRRRTSREDLHDHENPDAEIDDDHNPSLHEPWYVATAGLDEALIKSITVCKYNKGEGLVEGTDCSVCLSEFREDESLRLLPKCSHAFHIQCIDTWLRSHSNCPLCRANVVCVNPMPATTMTESFSGHESTVENDRNGSFAEQDQNFERVEETDQLGNTSDHVVPKSASTTSSSLRAFSDLGNLEERHSVIEIRRSVSMDHSSGAGVSVADILRMDHDDEAEGHGNVEGCSIERASCSKLVGKDGGRKGILRCVMSPVAMKRSVSSSRFFLTRPSGFGRGRHNVIIPL